LSNTAVEKYLLWKAGHHALSEPRSGLGIAAMPRIPHTFVDFHGDFPLPESFPAFPTSEETIPGKELAEYLAAELRAKGFDVEYPEPADFEHYIGWKRDSRTFELHVWVDDFSGIDRWTVQAGFQKRGFFGGSLRDSDVPELAALLEALDQILKESSRIRGIRWFPSFDVPDELNRQVGYAGPTSQQPVWQPEVTRVYRLITWHARLCDAGEPWCFRGPIAGVILFVVLAVLGFPEAAFSVGGTAFVLPIAAAFVALGTGACLRGVDAFQERLREGRTARGWVGLVLLLFAGTFFIWVGVGTVWAFMASCFRWGD
jgi:hypothetical protein